MKIVALPAATQGPSPWSLVVLLRGWPLFFLCFLFSLRPRIEPAHLVDVVRPDMTRSSALLTQCAGIGILAKVSSVRTHRRPVLRDG